MMPLAQALTGGWHRLTQLRRRHTARENYLCLMPQPGGLGCAMVRREGMVFKLVSCEWLPVATDADWPLKAGGSQEVGIVLPFGDYRLLVIDKPRVPPEELAQAVRWVAVSRMPEESPETLCLDMIPLDPRRATGEPELLVVVARKERLRRLVQQAQRQSLRPAVIDIPEMTQRNLASLLCTSQRHYALLALTPAGGLLTVTQGGDLCFYRHFDLDWGKLNGDESLHVRAQVERLSLELQRSLDFLERHHAVWQIDVLHVAPTLPAERLDQISDGLNTRLSPIDLDAHLAGTGSLTPEHLAHTWFALGGALRPLLT